MNILKKLAGVGVFILALASAIVLTKFYMRPAPTAPEPTPGGIVKQSPPAEAHEVAPSVSARLVTLDLERRKSYTTLVLERDRQKPAPEKLWVWTYFFTTDGTANRKIRADNPVEIKNPFANGDRVTINADAACTWCDDALSPTSGYYARVHVSTESKEAARQPAERLNYDITTATPVIVEAASKKSR